MAEKSAKKYEKTALGVRIAQYRKMAGFRDAQALADAIPAATVTRSTIVNIELGRKSDPTISEILAIAQALNRSPIELIVDLEDPFAPAEMPSVSVQLSNLEVLDWFRLRLDLKPRPEARTPRIVTLIDAIAETSSWVHDAEKRNEDAPLSPEQRRAVAAYRRIIEADLKELSEHLGVSVPYTFTANALEGHPLYRPV